MHIYCCQYGYTLLACWRNKLCLLTRSFAKVLRVMLPRDFDYFREISSDHSQLLEVISRKFNQITRSDRVKMSHDMIKPTKWVCAQRRLTSAWASAQSDRSQSLRCAFQWVAKDPSFLHADSEDSDQTGRMPRWIWVFARRTAILLVLSCRGSNGSYAWLVVYY